MPPSRRHYRPSRHSRESGNPVFDVAFFALPISDEFTSPQSPAQHRGAGCWISAHRSVAAIVAQKIEFLRRARSD
jgi:hypothetical protein